MSFGNKDDPDDRIQPMSMQEWSALTSRMTDAEFAIFNARLVHQQWALMPPEMRR